MTNREYENEMWSDAMQDPVRLDKIKMEMRTAVKTAMNIEVEKIIEFAMAGNCASDPLDCWRCALREAVRKTA